MRRAGANCPKLALQRSSNGIPSPDRPSRNMRVQFDDVSTSGPEPLVVGYRHRIGLGQLGLGQLVHGTHRLDADFLQCQSTINPPWHLDLPPCSVSSSCFLWSTLRTGTWSMPPTREVIDMSKRTSPRCYGRSEGWELDKTIW